MHRYFDIKLQPLLITLFITCFTSLGYALPENIEVISDIPYGEDKDQVLDVYYSPTFEKNAPVIFMVHGGAWRIGDKTAKSVVKNKVAHWVPKGFIFISINYPMLPKVQPIEQSENVAKAILFAQQHIHQWGGASEKFILMGHSAGAHLISLVTARNHKTLKPFLGSIALDSAAYDLVQIMNAESVSRFYKKAFGETSLYWQQSSPIYLLSGKSSPFLAVCSSKRKDVSCSQAERFLEKAESYGTQTQLLPIALSHRKINMDLGKENCYTAC